VIWIFTFSPPALIHNMSASEIRDLLAFLLNGGE